MSTDFMSADEATTRQNSSLHCLGKVELSHSCLTAVSWSEGTSFQTCSFNGKSHAVGVGAPMVGDGLLLVTNSHYTHGCETLVNWLE